MRHRLTIIFFSICLLGFTAKAQKEVKLSVQTGHSSSIVHLGFSGDGGKLASAGSDNKVVVWDVYKRKQVQILPGHEAPVTSVAFHPTRPLLATASQDGQVFIHNLINGATVWAQKSAPNVRLGLAFTELGDKLVVAGKDLSMYEWEAGIKTTSMIENVRFVRFSSDYSRFVAVENKGSVIVGETATMALIRRFRGNFDKARFSRDQQFLYAAGNNGILKRWPLNGSNLWKGMTITANRIWDSYYDVAVNDRHFIGANRDKMIYVRNHRSGKLEEVLKAHDYEVLALAVSPDGQVLASADKYGKILLWSIETAELIGELRGVSSRINDLVYGADGESIAMAYDNGSLRTAILDESMQAQQVTLDRSFWDRIRKFELSIHRITEYSEGRAVKFLAVKKIRSNKRHTNTLYKKYRTAVGYWDLKSSEIRLDKWEEVLGPDRSLVSQAPSNVHGFEKAEARLENNVIYLGGDSLYTGHSDQVTAVANNPAFDQFATASWDGSVKIWNSRDRSLALNYSAMGESDYIMTDPDNYYYATKGALRGIGFFVKGEVLAFDQFDIKYNRPDLVFSQLPYISSPTIKNFELAYNKRLSKLNLGLGDLTYDHEIPELHIDKTTVDYVVNDRHYSIAVEGSSIDAPLKTLHVLVNGVPLYGADGREIDNQKTYYQQVDLTLNPGRNKIEVYATNTNGVSSYREIIDVNCQAKAIAPDLYLVTIGASKYQMSDFNLTFAAKDAHDIAASFRRNKYFKNIHTLELINEDVRQESLSKIKAFIGKAKVEDVVIISVAGHGVLSEDFDYYLATYDMDFNNPEEAGIAYENMEKVLETTASRQKTLILDACHSGEVDKEELELTARAAKVQGSVTFRSVGAEVAFKNKVGLKSSFELSKHLFADMRKNNGATVISSAGAAEYAFEGQKWSNGLFTYVLLNGLESDKADLDDDGEIMLSELQKYLVREVPRMSGGLQTPTSRVENLNNDFRIK